LAQRTAYYLHYYFLHAGKAIGAWPNKTLPKLKKSCKMAEDLQKYDCWAQNLAFWSQSGLERLKKAEK